MITLFLIILLIADVERITQKSLKLCDGVAKLPCPSNSSQTRFTTSTKLYGFILLKQNNTGDASRKWFSKQILHKLISTRKHIVHTLANDVGRTSKENQQNYQNLYQEWTTSKGTKTR